MMDIAFEILKLASVGLVAGLFSSALSNRDHRQRKWWEMRVSAYQNAIEALSDLIYYYDQQYNAAIMRRELPEEFEKKLRSYWEQAFSKVRKFADSGAFLFSEAANAALQNLMNDDEEHYSMEHDLECSLTKARKCLFTLVECSKVDLKLKPSWLARLL